MRYSHGFKMNMIQRMTGTDPSTANALSNEVGVAQTTLSRWLREASVDASNPDMNGTTLFNLPTVNTTMITSKRPQDWTPEEKLQAVLEASRLSGDELGAFLRTKGLHETHLEQWRHQMIGGLQNQRPAKRGKSKSPEAKRVRELEKELTRKDKALAETAALLVLKKKVQAIWGDEDDDTEKKNGK